MDIASQYNSNCYLAQSPKNFHNNYKFWNFLRPNFLLGQKFEQGFHLDVALVILCFFSTSLCWLLKDIPLAVQVWFPYLKHIFAPLKNSVCLVITGVTFAPILKFLDIQVFPVVVITSFNHFLQSLRPNFNLFFFFLLNFDNRLFDYLLNFWFFYQNSLWFVSMFIFFKFIMFLLS